MELITNLMKNKLNELMTDQMREWYKIEFDENYMRIIKPAIICLPLNELEFSLNENYLKIKTNKVWVFLFVRNKEMLIKIW